MNSPIIQLPETPTRQVTAKPTTLLCAQNPKTERQAMPDKEYRVAVLESTSHATWVTAATPEEAKEKAEKLFNDDPDAFKVTEGGVDSIDITDEREVDNGSFSF